METPPAQVLNLGHLNKPPGFLALFFTLSLILLVLTSSSAAIGFFYGRASLKPTLAEFTISTTKQDGKTFLKTNVYQINFPENWTYAENKAEKNLKLTSKTGVLQIWILESKPFVFAKDEDVEIKETKTEIDVGGQKGELTEYLYPGNSYFSTIIVSESALQPQVTFWLEAENKTSYEELLETVKTFSFL